MNSFHGFPIRSLTSKYLELDCLAAAGPRIVRLRYKGSENLLAEVPGISIPTPYGEYRYLGGHRLWHAPEHMPRSYIPDDHGVSISEIPGGLVLDARPEIATGIHKRVEIRISPDEPRVHLAHSLINEGLWNVELAPWAITMLRLGGTAILPGDPADESSDELLPNRHFSLWPYTRVDDPRLHFYDGFILVDAGARVSPLKVGTFNSAGWIAYWLDGILFRKSFPVLAGRRHPDHDCNAEIYSDSHFIELESLGALSRLGPGEAVSLEETWELYDSLEQGFVTENMIASMGKQIR